MAVSEVQCLEVRGRPATLRRWRGAGPAVVLLHGAGGNHDTLKRLGDALAGRSMEVVAPSLPGRRGSDGPPCTSAAEAAAWVAALCDAANLQAPVLVGHSYGGAVAQELAFAHPDRWTGLVLVATGARLRVHPTILALHEEAARTGRPVDADRAAWRPHTKPAIVEEAAATAALTPPATALQDWRAADGFDRLSDVGRLTLPVLIVAGTEDVLTPPKYARFLAEHIPGAGLQWIEEEGHMVPMERPDEVAAAIGAFRTRVV